MGRAAVHVEKGFAARAPAIPVARPLLPPMAAIAPYLEEIDQSRWYSNFGPLVQRFEARLAERFGPTAQVSTAANATQALALGLRALNAPAGSYCMTPAWTFVATAHAILQAGLKPWFVDVDLESWMLDPVRAEAALLRAPGHVGAVIPVCAFGATPDLSGWLAFREQTQLPVLLDAAAAFDTLSDARIPACVSLHATKALGVGEGGYFVSEMPALTDRVRHLSSYGFNGSRDSLFPATNAKLSEYSAAVGHAALDQWPLVRARYLAAARLLRIACLPASNVRFQEGWGVTWVNSVCVVRVPDGRADAVTRKLAEMGVETRQWWGRGCHTSPAFADCARTDLPNTELLGASTVGLPFACDLSAADIERIAAALIAATA